MTDLEIHKAENLYKENKFSDAIHLYDQILKKNPGDFSALVNNAVSLRKLKKYSAANIYYQRALKIRPDDAAVWSNLGNLLCDMKLFDASTDAFIRASSLGGDSVENLYNAGNVPFNNNNPELAIELYAKALDKLPEHYNARWNMALSYLQMGDFTKGFAGYEARLEREGLCRKVHGIKRWNGEDLTNKKILLTREQGLGDMIQFCRFAQLLKRRGAEVFWESPQALKRYMFCVIGIDHVVDEGYLSEEIDYYLPIMSLPYAFDITLKNLIETNEFVDADRFIPLNVLPKSSRKKIGLVWASKSDHPLDRSCALEKLSPLMANLGVEFYSFQKGDSVKDIYDLGFEGLIHDMDPYLSDFYDTACYMKQMDLVISIDSSPLHCAASLGIKTWGLLLHASDWRWLLSRTDSPWYPSLTLFRQVAHHDWDAVLDNMCIKFKELIS